MPKAIRGVNLGGWLVLEPWITPSLFQDTQAVDEFTYCDTASPDMVRRLSQHRKQFVTRQDFKWLADHAITAVRLPVGYWVFGDQLPYIGAIDYVDSAFGWAEEFGIKIVLCLHGAPGSQNGAIHSGRQGEVNWHADPGNIDLAVRIIERLAQRYAGRPGLLGIELLNEPAPSIPSKHLNRYYRRGYRAVRQACGAGVWVVYGDTINPQPWRWQWTLHWPLARAAYFDTHQYQLYSLGDKQLDLPGHLRKLAGPVAWLLRLIGWHRRYIVGEWSAALDAHSLRGLSASQKVDAYRQYCQAQIIIFDRADAWFYWTYRTEEGGVWSLRDCIASGWLDS